MEPADVRARRAVAVGEYKSANLVVDKNPNAAIEGYRRAMAELSRLPQDARSLAPTERLFIVIEGHMGRAYLTLGKPTEAVAAITGARDRTAELIAKDPLDDRARYDMHTTLRSLGEALTAAGDKRRARKAYGDALEAIAFLLKRDPDNAVLKQHRQEVEVLLGKLK